jgi:hypothetical protein
MILILKSSDAAIRIGHGYVEMPSNRKKCIGPNILHVLVAKIWKYVVCEEASFTTLPNCFELNVDFLFPKFEKFDCLRVH